MGDAVDLSGGWDTIWTAVGGGDTATQIMAAFGVVLVVAGIAYFLFSKLRGKSGDARLWWAVVVGAVLAAPDALLPMVLWAFDLLANIVVRFVEQFM